MDPSPVLSFGPSHINPSPQPKPNEEEEKKETKEEFANRLTRAFMEALDPGRSRLNKQRRKMLRKFIYRTIINELEKSPKDKDGNIVPPAQLRIPGI